ncbi:MAG: RNA polymerase sigma factor [Planctomycetota bacterium]
MQSASRGDPVAVEALLARFLPELRAFLRLRTGPRLLARETPDDLAQSVCREVLEHAGDFDYRGEQAFKSWLFLTALHKLQDKGRYYAAEKRDAERQRPEASAPDDCSGYASLLSPSRVAIGREEVGRLAAAFDQLSDEHREVITLHRILGLDHEQIGRQTGRTAGASRVLLHRALARLGRLLGQADG